MTIWTVTCLKLTEYLLYWWKLFWARNTFYSQITITPASPTLAKHFTDNSTHLCGAIRTNRYNYSKDIINEALEKGDAVFYLNTDEAMIACKYWSAKDKASGQQKVVYMLLTCHQPLMVNIANRQEGKPVVLWDNTIYIWVVLTKLTSNYTVYVFLAKHINGIENLHWYLYCK